MVRATVVLALAYGLTNGIPALAAPPLVGAKPTENLFEDRGTDDDDASEAKPSEAAPSEDDAAPDSASTAGASRGEPESDAAESEEAPESALHGLACLEGDATGGRRKGVQRRDFLKRHRFEFSGVGGFYAADALSSTYSYGGALSFYPSEDFGLEALVSRSPMQFRLEEAFTAFDQQTHFHESIAWQGMLSLLWSPIHAKFKFSETRIIHSDLFAVAGAGRTFDPSVLGLTWEVGTGLKLYFNRFVAFRLDLRDFLLPQEVLGRGRITNNINVLAGFSLWLG
ncbi:MAG TPA: outer membrane beta-barrel domain-containing protein [Polyangia bacterium]|nr:outer membrane beta-barrel domain-containing protein [Polyangia bacterium]